MKNNIKKLIFYNVPLTNQIDTYNFIAKIIMPQNPEEAMNEFFQREKNGSIKIANCVLLPHIENDNLLKSQILFLKLENKIKEWNKHDRNVELLIVIALKKKDTNKTKRQIINFMKLLADDDYLKKLLEASTESEFNSLTNIF